MLSTLASTSKAMLDASLGPMKTFSISCLMNYKLAISYDIFTLLLLISSSLAFQSAYLRIILKLRILQRSLELGDYTILHDSYFDAPSLWLCPALRLGSSSVALLSSWTPSSTPSSCSGPASTDRSAWGCSWWRVAGPNSSLFCQSARRTTRISGYCTCPQRPSSGLWLCWAWICAWLGCQSALRQCWWVRWIGCSWWPALEIWWLGSACPIGIFGTGADVQRTAWSLDQITFIDLWFLW